MILVGIRLMRLWWLVIFREKRAHHLLLVAVAILVGFLRVKGRENLQISRHLPFLTLIISTLVKNVIVPELHDVHDL